MNLDDQELFRLIYQHATREREDAIAAGLDTMVRLRRA